MLTAPFGQLDGGFGEQIYSLVQMQRTREALHRLI